MSSPAISRTSSIQAVKSGAPSLDEQFTEEFRAAYKPSFWDHEKVGFMLKNKQPLSMKIVLALVKEEMEAIKEGKIKENKFSSTYNALIKMGIVNKYGDIEKQNVPSNLFIKSNNTLVTKAFFEAVKAGKSHAVLTFIVNDGINTNVQNENGDTPLILAIKNNDVKMLNILLRYRAIVQMTDNRGKTPFHIACAQGNREIMQLLLENPHKSDACYTDLGASGLPPTITNKADINAPDDKGDTPLILAIKENKKKMVEWLLNKGAKINNPNPYTRDTPIHAACSLGQDVEILRLLLEYHNDADINARDRNGDTPLHIATQNNSEESAQLLAGYPYCAEVNCTNLEGMTALHYASSIGNSIIVNCLMRYMSLNAINANTKYRTSVHLTSTKNNVGIIFRTGRNGANMNYTNWQGMTALELAAVGSHTESIKILSKYTHRYPIVFCAKNGLTESLKVVLALMTSQEVYKRLIYASPEDDSIPYDILEANGIIKVIIEHMSTDLIKALWKFVEDNHSSEHYKDVEWKNSIRKNKEEALTTIEKAEAHATMNNKASLSPELLELFKENTNLPMDTISIIKDYSVEFKTAADARHYLIEQGIFDLNGKPILLPVISTTENDDN